MNGVPNMSASRPPRRRGRRSPALQRDGRLRLLRGSARAKPTSPARPNQPTQSPSRTAGVLEELKRF